MSGKVTGKREENGEKLIDLEVKCTNQNGQDTLQGHATGRALALDASQSRRDETWVRWMARWRSSPARAAASASEIALRLVRDGAKVVINDIDEAPAKETIAEIEKMGGKAVACNGDVAKPDFGDRIVKTAVDAFGDCHVVVNNAGYTWDSVIQKMSDEQWYAILDVHLTAPFRVLRAFQQHFRQAVEKERAEGKRIVRKVVNISSTSGVNGNAGQSNYSAGKAGIVGLTKTLAKEFGRYDVTVNAVAFGYIQTRLTKPLAPGRGRRDRGPGPQGQDRRAGRPHRRHEPDDPARPRRPAGRGGRLGLSLLQPRQRLCQRPVPGGERRALTGARASGPHHDR